MRSNENVHEGDGLMRKLAWLAVAAIAVIGAGTANAQETPRKGGTLRMTAPYAASFGSLDPHTTPRAQDDIVNKAIHRTLYNWDTANSKLVLELAKSVSTSADGMTHTFRLRDDAYFHNGRKMTADDLIYSYTRLMDGSKGYPGARFARIIKGAVDVEKGQAKEISGLKKIDDFTLEITVTDLVDPGYFFDGSTAILPKEEVEKGNFAANPVGLGPFKFKEHIPGSRVVAERFDKFYKPGQPYLAKVEVLIMAEAAARDVAFRNKEVDTSILGPAQYVAYRADPILSKSILEVAEMFTRSMRFNIDSIKPFQDKRVRQAINYAIDSNLIINRLVKDKAYRATSWLPPSSASFDKTVKPYPYDPEKARKLLAEAGYPNGFEFEWTTSQNESWGLPIVEAVIPMLARVGIKAKPKLVEVTVLTEIAMKGDNQALIASSQTGPDSLAVLRCFYSKTPRTACNYTGFKNAEFDKLLDDAAQEGDMAKRAELLKKANNLLFEEAPVWFFNYNKAVLAFQPWVHGLQPNPTEITHQYLEDVWVDARSPAK